MRTTVCALIGLALALTMTRVATAEDPAQPLAAQTAKELGLSLSLTPNYSEGKYGTRHTTEILRVPLAVEWFVTDRLDFTLTVPYLWEHGQSILALLGGRVARAPHRINLPPRGRRRVQAARVQTEDGLGDVLLEGEFVLLEDRDLFPEVAALGEIKFPTADPGKGLGTGEFDETIGLDLTKRLGDSWTPYASLSYTFVGSPPGIHLDNFFGWSLGLGYDVTRTLRLTSSLDGSTAVTRTETAPLDVRLGIAYSVTKMLRLRLEGLKGLSNGAPQLGVSAGLTLRF